MSEASRTEAQRSPLGRAAEAQKQQATPGYLARAWVRLRRDKVSMGALGLLILILLSTLGAPLISDHVLHVDPNRQQIRQKYRPPSSEHRFGTDEYGRDTLARVLHAGRVSLAIGFMVAAISLTIGVAFGLTAGYFSGRVDDFINGIIQLINNIPLLFLLILLSVLYRPGVVGLAVIFGLTGWTGIARQVRGRVFSERKRDYVDAATVVGASTGRIMFGHILPNVSSIILVLVGFDVAGAILAEAALSALGFGVKIPTASWGNMLSASLDTGGLQYWWLIIAPGVMISLTLFAIYLFNDGLRDALDPRIIK